MNTTEALENQKGFMAQLLADQGLSIGFVMDFLVEMENLVYAATQAADVGDDNPTDPAHTTRGLYCDQCGGDVVADGRCAEHVGVAHV